jgi:hypothetical protein
MEAEVRAEDPEHPPAPGFVAAFADDAGVGGDPRVLYRVAEQAAPIFAAIGLRLVLSKSKLIGRTVEDHQGFPADVQPCPSGAKHLGCPVGSVEFQKEFVAAKVVSMMPSRAAMRLLRPTTAWCLLSLCVNRRPAYLASVCHPDVTMAALKDFDHAVSVIVGDIASMPATDPDLQLLRGLPSSLGGLGLSNYAGVFTERLSACSRARAIGFMEQHQSLSELLQTCPLNPTFMSEISIGKAENLTAHNGLEEEPVMNNQPNAFINFCTKLREAEKKVKKYQQETRLQALCEDPIQRQLGGPYKAAFTRSCAHSSSSRFLNAVARSGTVACRMKNDVFRGMIQLRLHGSVRPSAEHAGANQQLVCRCASHSARPTVPHYLLPHHALLCDLNKPNRVFRHNAARDNLARFCKHADPSLRVNLEQEYNCPDGHQLVVDIVITRPTGEKIYVDVKIVDPCANVIIEPQLNQPELLADDEIERLRSKELLGSQYRKDVASRAKEDATTSSYSRRTNGALAGNRDVFVPFVVETSGRLGPAALAFIQAIMGPPPENRNALLVYHSSRTSFLYDISVSLAIAHGGMVGRLRGNLVAHQ